MENTDITESVDVLEERSVQAYRSGNVKKARKIQNRIYRQAVGDEKFRVSVVSRYDWVSYNMEKTFEGVSTPPGSLSIAILAYVSGAVGTWDPDKTRSGLTGSEEAIVYAGQALATMGHTVTVYANPPPKSVYSLPRANPRYLPEPQWKEDSKPFDMVVMWRRTDFSVGTRRGPVYFWPHDLPTHTFGVEYLTGAFFLTNFHRDEYLKITPALKDVPYCICGNGLQLEDFPTPTELPTNPYACIYASNYARGLSVLLNAWPEIHEKFPEATLDIYYGRQVWNSISPEALRDLIALIEELKPQGVTERGQVGHQELALALRRASLLTYPCSLKSETFCITAIKAQAAGLIPVTTRIDALAETVHPEAPAVPDVATPGARKYYKHHLMKVMENIEEHGTLERRRSYHTFASAFTWDATVSHWLRLHASRKNS